MVYLLGMVVRSNFFKTTYIKADQLVNYWWSTKEGILNVSGEARSHVIVYMSDHIIS